MLFENLSIYLSIYLSFWNDKAEMINDLWFSCGARMQWYRFCLHYCLSNSLLKFIVFTLIKVLLYIFCLFGMFLWILLDLSLVTLYPNCFWMLDYTILMQLIVSGVVVQHSVVVIVWIPPEFFFGMNLYFIQPNTMLAKPYSI